MPNGVDTNYFKPKNDIIKKFDIVFVGNMSYQPNIEAATLVKQYSQMAIVPVSEPKYPTPLAWLTPQEDQVWINYLNHWIEIKKAQGFSLEPFFIKLTI